MLYSHQYFVLNDENKQTFDENGKELRLTGNAYRLLFFLCRNKSANLTQIGEFFDFANDYSENHIRQYRYKINLIVGHDVIEYKNGLYSVKGSVEKQEKNDINQRNTDLLRRDVLLSGSNSIADKNNLKLNIYPAIFGSILLLLTVFNWPYSFYTLLRLMITGISAYYAYYIYQTKGKNSYWLWPLIVIIILFNPIAPIYLYKKEIWTVIDLVTACFLVALIYFLEKLNKGSAISND